ncbi:MAG: response regulator [Terriglobia bacterium]
MPQLRILLADDHPVVLNGLRSLLETQPDWQVCGEAGDGQEAIAEAERLKPDVAVLDLSMPKLNGIEAARRIVSNTAHPEVLILTVHESEEMVREALQAGARGYVLKSDAGDELVIAVRALSQHKPFLSRRFSDQITNGSARRAKHAGPSTLSARERQVVQLLAEGETTKDVAASLGIKVKTAETHRANIMRKLGIHSASGLVRYAIRNKIVQP